MLKINQDLFIFQHNADRFYFQLKVFHDMYTDRFDIYVFLW